MTTNITTEATSDAGVLELSETDLISVAGGAHQASGSTYGKHKEAMSGKTFAGASGSGSTFSLQEEDINTSSFEAQDDQ